jgi:hypothetical protein
MNGVWRTIEEQCRHYIQICKELTLVYTYSGECLDEIGKEFEKLRRRAKENNHPYSIPIPIPKDRARDKKRCQISKAKDAPRSPAVSQSIPINSPLCVPNFRAQMVARGEIMSAIEIESPPTKA